MRQGAGLPQPHGSDLSAETLVRTSRRESLRHCIRRPGQDCLGAVRYWRRPGRRGADRAGLRPTFGGFRPRGVSYIFAGEQELDLGLAPEILNRELGIERLLLEGGGGSNGAFLRAGLTDEIGDLSRRRWSREARRASSTRATRMPALQRRLAPSGWRPAKCWRAARFGCAIGFTMADAKWRTPVVASRRDRPHDRVRGPVHARGPAEKGGPSQF
jgi:hypothetical protein